MASKAKQQRPYQHQHQQNHSEHTDLVPLNVPNQLTQEWSKPSSEECAQITDKTKAIFEKKLQSISTPSLANSSSSNQSNAPKFIKYTPHAQQQGKIIQLVEMPKDPLEPPKFGFQRLPPGPPSPPAPVMHSPPRKLTLQDKEAWKIPPCISNWKNAKGYTIPLDKRLAADGRGLQVPVINDQFAKFSEALMIAERHAREEVRQRSVMQQKLAEKEKSLKDEQLRALAQKAREERATGMVPLHSSLETASTSPLSSSASRYNGATLPSDDTEVKERDSLRKDTYRQLQRDFRMQHMGQETKAMHFKKLGDRDISEKIALGLHQPTANATNTVDTRLMNQSEGLSSGFGDEEAYSVYDRPLFSHSQKVYRPNIQSGDQEVYGGNAGGGRGDDTFHTLSHADRFEKPLTSFKGANPLTGSNARDAPVEFEKDTRKSKDPFGLDAFMSQARKGGSTSSSTSSSKRHAPQDFEKKEKRKNEEGKRFKKG